jgi:ComF family protein
LHQIDRGVTPAPMGGWTAVAADLLFPRACVACDGALAIGHPEALCGRCWATLPMPDGPLCDRCGIPVPPPLLTCQPCATRPPAYDRARSLGLYLSDRGQLNPLARAVRALKFHGQLAVARSLGRALVPLAAAPPDAVVVPVPLHVDRLRERGYDQAALLAHALARAAGLPVAVRALRRIRPTPAQTTLDAATRRSNLRGAFASNARAPAPVIVLVDDVLTTGATADACARTLRSAGAARVVVVTVGRTP